MDVVLGLGDCVPASTPRRFCGGAGDAAASSLCLRLGDCVPTSTPRRLAGGGGAGDVSLLRRGDFSRDRRGGGGEDVALTEASVSVEPRCAFDAFSLFRARTNDCFASSSSLCNRSACAEHFCQIGPNGLKIEK